MKPWYGAARPEQFVAAENLLVDLLSPVWISVGRVAADENIERFLQLDLPGSKVFVGDGPDRRSLQSAYPDCRFPGYMFGRDLSMYLAAADVFVYPCRIDTFGLLLLEAMAGGLPIAALPPDGRMDVYHAGVTGILDNDLELACLAALRLDREICRRFAENERQRHTTEQIIFSLARRAYVRRNGSGSAIRPHS